MADNMMRIAGRNEDGLAKALSVVTDENGNGVLRTVDAAPVAYEPATDSSKVKIVGDSIGMEDLISFASEFYLNEKIKLGLLGNFEQISVLPTSIGEQPKMVYGGNGHIYAILAPYQSGAFYRYSIGDDLWQKMASMPTSTYAPAMAYDGKRYIYIIKGNTTLTFWRYDTIENTFLALADFPSPAPAIGANLMYNDNGFIYAVKGSSNSFLKYDITLNTWSALANLPASNYKGANIVSAGNPDILYVNLGSAGANNSKKLYKYTISTNAFTELADAPDFYAGSMIYTGSNYLIVAKGMNTRTMWKYNIASNTWETLSNADGAILSGACQMAYAGNGKAYGFQGDSLNVMWEIPFAFNSWKTWMK